MALPVNIQPYGNQLGILMDDGTTILAVPTNGSMWVVTASNDEPGGQFIWPFPLAEVSSEYGERDTGFHEGIDFAGATAHSGANIPATSKGHVTLADTGHPGFGNYVVLYHGVKNGKHLHTLYAHMNNTPIVNTGDDVVQGQTLGHVGDTGNSYGAHLHYETHLTGVANGGLNWDSPGQPSGPGTHMNPRTFMEEYNG